MRPRLMPARNVPLEPGALPAASLAVRFLPGGDFRLQLVIFLAAEQAYPVERLQMPLRAPQVSEQQAQFAGIFMRALVVGVEEQGAGVGLLGFLEAAELAVRIADPVERIRAGSIFVDMDFQVGERLFVFAGLDLFLDGCQRAGLCRRRCRRRCPGPRPFPPCTRSRPPLPICSSCAVSPDVPSSCKVELGGRQACIKQRVRGPATELRGDGACRLTGVRVVELAQIIAGPVVGQVLGRTRGRCHQGRAPGRR